MITPDLVEEFKKALQEEHDRLVAELHSFAKEKRGVWNVSYPQFEQAETASHASMDEEADEVEEYETRLATDQSLESRLLEVNRALDRIAKGTYGSCKKCKKEIPLERLRANPSAEFDIDHS